MSCEFCLQIGGKHDFRCPNYSPRKAQHYCSSCGEGIINGEEYIVNQDLEYRHYGCFHGMRELLEWLGYEVKTMEDTYEGNY